ncbi:MAG: ribbon-helix-helix protein, CopG family [Chloroflexi bacterium]|nr:ribbon-helix-helix protein, CopG family [Chloroflexota bacterium]
MTAIKTAVSLPEDLFRQLDHIAGEQGVSRSSVVAEALRCWLRDEETREMMRRLDEAYSNPTPEEEAENRAWAARRRATRRRIIDKTGDTWLPEG